MEKPHVEQRDSAEEGGELLSQLPPSTSPMNSHACAHAVVNLVTDPDGEGPRAWWECHACHTPFAPIPREHETAIRASEPPPEYLSVKDLCRWIPYRPGTIRNLMSQGKLRLGVHYVKKNNGRIMFLRSAMKAWIEEDTEEAG
jgi:hypothetical protein